MTETIKNIPASVRQRLVNMAKARGIEFQRLLVLYATERLLYRLSVSPFADNFILKGASLFSLWLAEPHRRTRDVDLLGRDEPDIEQYVVRFTDLCSFRVAEDGLAFDPAMVKAKLIREGNDFGGIRVTLTACLENARIVVQVDIGFGDAVVPEPEIVGFPTIIHDFPAPHLLAYQKETTIAEKLHALVILERTNSRMKDFFDLYVLSQEFSFTMDRLSPAVREGFAGRSTEIPIAPPDGLTQEFVRDPAKLTQWRAFLKQNVSPPRNAYLLSDVIGSLSEFLMPVLFAARTNSNHTSVWKPGGPWKNSDTS